MKLKLPQSAQNWISLAGAVIALISFFMIVFLFAVTSVLTEQASYIGLIIYILLPAVMIAGLVMIPIGMFKEMRRQKRTHEAPAKRWPRIDLNDMRHRNAFMVFIIGTSIFLFISAIGSYEAFHYTESVSFCGTICHKVMKPEYTAYQNSSHARVACVDCHVGSGADWYVRSKLSGLYQVYAVLANVYPKPIPTPIENLRPARETCETCHWPQKFYAHKVRMERHYLNDEENTRWDIYLKMKIGSEHAAHGLKEGIHWHINPDVHIEYIPASENIEEIPWVKYTNRRTGETTVYQSGTGELDSTLMRTMDCMDCHNRPSHSYSPPAYFVNQALTAGDMPAELPEIKSLSMEICAEEFTSTDSAMQYIRTTIYEYYESNYPALVDSNQMLVEQAVTGLQAAYGKNIFPEMRVRWSAYPNHIGHLEFNGCFRCHDNEHESADGQVISKDCSQCHDIVAQGRPGQMERTTLAEALPFQHPVDIYGAWEESLCTDCHTGLNP